MGGGHTQRALLPYLALLVVLLAGKATVPSGGLQGLMANAAHRLMLAPASSGPESALAAQQQPPEGGAEPAEGQGPGLGDGELGGSAPPAVPPASPAAAGGGSTQQQGPGVAAGTCSIYVMDPSTDLAPLVGMPPCDPSNPKFWPHDEPGQGVDGLDRTPHWAHQYSYIYWIAKAIRESPYATSDIHAADLLYVDSHCLMIRRVARGLRPKRAERVASELLNVITRGMPLHPRFQARNGSDFVLSIPYPAMSEVGREAVCGVFRSTFLVLPENPLLCPPDQRRAREGRALIMPHSAVLDIPDPAAAAARDRPLFLFYRGSCPKLTENRVLRVNTAGKLLRRALVVGLNGTAPDIEVGCSCGICPGAMTHHEMMAKQLRAVFCPVIAGDTQSSRRLTEIVLSGCVPVFVGPPFHTLTLAQDVDYLSFSVFVNMTNTSDWFLDPSVGGVHASPHSAGHKWIMDLDVPPEHMLQAATFPELAAQLRRMPPEAVRAKQEALQRERGKFLFEPPPGQRSTPLMDAVLGRLCAYAELLRREGGGPAQRARLRQL